MISFGNLGAGKEKGHNWTDSKLGASRAMSQKVDMRILKSFQGKLMATIMLLSACYAEQRRK